MVENQPILSGLFQKIIYRKFFFHNSSFGFCKKLGNNWRSAAYSLHEIVAYGVKCFSMNTTKIFTAECIENKWLIKTWNRKSLNCERVTNLVSVTLFHLTHSFVILYGDFHRRRPAWHNHHGLQRWFSLYSLGLSVWSPWWNNTNNNLYPGIKIWRSGIYSVPEIPWNLFSWSFFYFTL